MKISLDHCDVIGVVRLTVSYVMYLDFVLG